MEEQITIVGTILLGAFYSIGYLLNQQAKNKVQKPQQPEEEEDESVDVLSTLSSTASQSTSLNVLLWQRLTMLEEEHETQVQEIEDLKLSHQIKDQRITDLEAQVQNISTENIQLPQSEE